MKTTRRTILAGLASSLPLSDSLAWLATPPSVAPQTTAATVEITFPGGVPTASTLVFDIANGADLGDYVAPTAGFTQHCNRVRTGSLANFFVDFRNDSSGTRSEVVVWNGEVDPVNLTVTSGYTRNLRPYNVVVKDRSGSTLYSALIPQHYWGTRWRWQSAVRPVIRTLAQIVSDGYMLPMSTHAARLAGNNGSTGQPWSGLPYASPIVPATPPSEGIYTPFMPPAPAQQSTTLSAGASGGATAVSLTSTSGMSVADFIVIQLADTTFFTTRLLTTTNPCNIELPLPSAANSGATAYTAFYHLGLLGYIETGGERFELGMMSEWAGDYLLNGTASSLSAIRQHADIASGEWPFFLSDLNTNAAINFKSDVTHYKVIVYQQNYSGYYRAAYTNMTNCWDFHESDSHFQMHMYVPYALTEDAYYAEGCQYLVQYGAGSAATMLGREGNPGATHGQYGWGDLLSVSNGTGGVNGAFTMCSYYGETRTVGNGIRNLAMAYKTAPTSPPSWLLPKSYYAALGSDYSKVIDVLWTNPTVNAKNRNTVFKQLGADNYFQAFEQSYGIMGMALADLVGLGVGAAPSWFSTLTNYFGFLDAITNGTSGWNNQTPQPHDIENQTVPEVCNASICFLNFQNYASWSALYAACTTFMHGSASFPAAATPGNQQGGSMGNCSVIYAACACAKSRGVVAATNAMSWMNTFIDYNYPNNADASMGIAFEMKFGFDGT